MNQLTSAYKLAEPALAGYFFGNIQSLDRPVNPGAPLPHGTEKAFAVRAALTVLTSTALPLSWKARGLAAIASGATAYFSHRYTWVKKNNSRILTIATLASCPFELYKGQRAYPLAKIAGVLTAHLDMFLWSEGEKWKEVAREISRLNGLIVLPWMVGSAIQGGVLAYGKFVKLGTESQIIIGIFIAAIPLSLITHQVGELIGAIKNALKQTP